MNRWSQDTESFLIFNPRDEAVRESQQFNPNNPLSMIMMSQSQGPKLKEAMEHLNYENAYLKE
jgi:hypothetical protein